MQPRTIHITAVLFAFTALSGCGTNESTKNSGPKLPAEYRQYPTNTGNATLDLWNVINGNTLLLNSNCSLDTTEGRARRDMIGQIYLNAMMRGSMRDADPDLVAWSLLVITSHKQHECFSEFFEDLMQEEAADPAFKSVSVQSSRLGQQFGQLWTEEQAGLRREGLRLQQLLSERQGKPFPPCTF